MLSHILQGILLGDATVNQRVGKAGIAVGLHFEVRGNAAAVLHRTSVRRCEAVGEGVGDVSHTAVLVAVAVVDGLHASARRRIVLGGGHLELAIVGQRTDALHKALSEGARTGNGGAVVVLQGAGDNLTGRCTAAVYQHQDGNLGVYRVCGGLICGSRSRGPALGTYHDRTLGDKERNNVHGLVHKAAAVAAKIQHQALHALGLKGVVGIPDALAHAVGEFIQKDVAVLLIEHAHIREGRQHDAFARYRNVNGLSPQLFHTEHHLCTGLSPHAVTALLAGEAVGGNPVNSLYLISAVKPCLGSRRTGIGLVDNDVSVHVRLIDDGANTSVGVAQHHLEVFLLFLRHIDGIGIQRLQLGIDAGPLDASHLQGVHIGTVEFFQNGIFNLYPLAQGKAF